MSDLFKTVLVKDSIIGDITSDMDYAVQSGASQTTYQPFPATSASNSALIFNVQVPSENVVLGRDLLVSTGITFTITASGADAGNLIMDIGNTDSLQAFPFNSLLNTATAQINNTTVSINTQDVLPSILRMNDSRELYRYNSMTPSLPDQAYADYGSAIGTNNNPLASYSTASYDLDQVPRGAFPIRVVSVSRQSTGSPTPPPVTGTFESTATTDVFTIVLQTQVCEPLFLSPFIWGNPEFNSQGLLGINNISFTFNVDATCRRLWSSSTGYITNISLGQNGQGNGFTSSGTIGVKPVPTNPAILMKFLSTQPSDLIQTKNIVPYIDYPRYLTVSGNNPSMDAFTTQTLTSSNLQINQIPDLFLITVRKPMSQQDWNDSMSQFIINSISINLNNQSGLLSSASQFDLWRMSSKNGSAQSFVEFGGQALVNNGTTGQGGVVYTTGSVLVINPAYDLSLPDYITCGSLGNYNFQFSASVTNQSNQTIQPEICVICVNSGIFTTQQGVSAVYTGILTKEMVLATKASRQVGAFTSQEVSRMVGGKMLNRCASAMKGMGRSKMGGVMSAGVESAGAMSAGVGSGGRSRLSKHY
jgi:hypothetical protein